MSSGAFFSPALSLIHQHQHSCYGSGAFFPLHPPSSINVNIHAMAWQPCISVSDSPEPPISCSPVSLTDFIPNPTRHAPLAFTIRPLPLTFTLQDTSSSSSSSSSSPSSSSRASVLKGDVVMLLADDDGHWLYVAPVDGDSCGFVPRARLEIASVSTSPSCAWQPWSCVTGREVCVSL
jgi:hypothetical protein